MKWVEALRSGKYEQGEYQLRTEDDKFCCLGVLCEVRGIKSKRVRAAYLYLGKSGFYPANHGLKTSQGRIPSLLTTLTILNDGVAPGYVERLTFDEIADIIQICYKEL